MIDLSRSPLIVNWLATENTPLGIDFGFIRQMRRLRVVNGSQYMADEGTPSEKESFDDRKETALLKRVVALCYCLLAAVSVARCEETERGEQDARIQWSELATLPDAHGFAGGFAGVSHGALLFAGGANFPDAPPWKGGKKVWYDSIFMLESPGGNWRLLDEKLPHQRAYGVSVTYKNHLILIGGDDGQNTTDEVLALEWRNGKFNVNYLPKLPQPCTAMCGALVGNKIYIAGGLTYLEGQANRPLETFWMLDLEKVKFNGPKLEDTEGASEKWLELNLPTDAPPRFQAVAVSIGGEFYLAGGIDLEEGPEGKPRRKLPLLRDAYKYTPPRLGVEGKWTRLSEVPRGIAAAASPAPVIGERHFLIVGGVDDQAAQLATGDISNHPGFETQCLAYHTITDTWIPLGKFPAATSRVTVPAVFWKDGKGNAAWVLPSGESRPGVRSPKVFTVRSKHQERGFGVWDWTTLVVYLGLLVGMGFYFSRRENTTADYFVGGKRIPAWAVGLSIYATMLSSISYVVGPAKVFDVGWIYFISVLTIPAVAPIVVYCFLPFFRQLDVTSAYEYLEQRFDLGIRIFGSLSFMVFQIGRMTVVLFIPALALSAVTGINVYTCIVLMGVLATLYTVLGGIEAVVWTDVLQVFVLLGAAILCLGLIVFGTEGGIFGFFQQAKAAGQFKMLDLDWDIGRGVLWVMLLGGLFQNIISYGADQAVVQRYLTTPDEKSAARAIWTGALMAVPGSAIMFLLGSALFVYFQNHPEALSPALKNDQIFPHFVSFALPPGMVGLVIAGIFAATMSTLDSSLNSVTAVFITDFYRRFKRDVDDAVCLRLARRLTLLLGAMAIGAAFLLAAHHENVKSLWDWYVKVLGLIMGCLAGVFMLGLFSRRVGPAAAWIGVGCGAVTLGLTTFLTMTDKLIVHDFLIPVVGVGSTFVIGWLASLALPIRRKDLAALTVFTRRRRE